MKLAQKALVFFTDMMSGIWFPVLSLILLSKGCSLKTLSWVLCCFSVTTILFEVPSGIFADRMGRKSTFLLACFFWGIHILLLLTASGLALLIPSMIFYGLGKAFASGSVDALLVEQYLEEHGAETLTVITGQISCYRLTGLICGTIVGGVLPTVNHYAVHSWVRMGLLLLITLMCCFFLHERHDMLSEQKRVSLQQYVKKSVNLIRSTHILPLLFLCSAGLGAVLAMVETYWQPALTTIASEQQLKLLGIIAASGFLASLGGTILIQRIRLFDFRKQRLGYFLSAFLIGCFVILFAFQHKFLLFALSYVVIYFFVGASNILEQTLMNRSVENSQRAGLLSMLSLSMQLGGVISSAGAGFAVVHYGFQGMWIASAVILMMITIFGFCSSSKHSG